MSWLALFIMAIAMLNAAHCCTIGRTVLIYFYDIHPCHLHNVNTTDHFVLTCVCVDLYLQHLTDSREKNDSLRRSSWTPDTVDPAHNAVCSPIHSG